MNVIGVLLCGGSSQRMGFNKLTTPLGGSNALARSASLLAASGCDKLVIAVTTDTRPAAEALSLPIPVTLCDGGSTRGQSVLNALRSRSSSSPSPGRPIIIWVTISIPRCARIATALSYTSVL